jgi:hypothetical protein
LGVVSAERELNVALSHEADAGGRIERNGGESTRNKSEHKTDMFESSLHDFFPLESLNYSPR